MQKIKSTACLLGLFIAVSANANAPMTANPAAASQLDALTSFDQFNNGAASSAPLPLDLPPITHNEMQQNQTLEQIQQLQQMQQMQQAQTQQNSPMNSQASPQLNQATSLASVPTTQAAPPRRYGTVNDPAFQNVLKKQFPLSPEQILRLREVMQDTQRATATPLQPPTPTVSTQTVSLSPGTIPPVIRLATGYVSSIVFVDETGAPWPIVGYSIGNPSAFNVQWDQKSNVLMMQGVGAYQTGNLAVQLTGLSMPVMVTIVNDQKVVDYRIDLRLQGRGPNAHAAILGDGVPAAATPLLLNLLDGVPPPSSEGLTVTGGEAQGWLHNNMIYLRTRLTVLSPAWNSTMTSPDGMKVYELNTTPMILASDQGQTVALKVEGL